MSDLSGVIQKYEEAVKENIDLHRYFGGDDSNAFEFLAAEQRKMIALLRHLQESGCNHLPQWFVSPVDETIEGEVRIEQTFNGYWVSTIRNGYLDGKIYRSFRVHTIETYEQAQTIAAEMLALVKQVEAGNGVDQALADVHSPAVPMVWTMAEKETAEPAPPPNLIQKLSNWLKNL